MLLEDSAGGKGEKRCEKPGGERSRGDGQKCCRSTSPLCAITAGFHFTVSLIQMETLSNLHYLLSFPIKPLWPFSCMTVSYISLLCKASLCNRQCIPGAGRGPGRAGGNHGVHRDRLGPGRWPDLYQLSGFTQQARPPQGGFVRYA